jgi:hypothetical protein
MPVLAKANSNFREVRNYAVDFGGRIASQELAMITSPLLASVGIYLHDFTYTSIAITGAGVALGTATAVRALMRRQFKSRFRIVLREDKARYNNIIQKAKKQFESDTKRDRDVQKQIDKLLIRLRDYARRIELHVDCLEATRQPGRALTDTEVTILVDLKRALLKRVCAIAAQIFDLLKPEFAPFTANIKAIQLYLDPSNGQFVAKYLPQARSHVSVEAVAYDSWLEDGIAIADNAVYRRLLADEKGLAKNNHFEWKKDYFMHEDIAAFIRELDERSEECAEPNKEFTVKLFSSCFVSPIWDRVTRDVANSKWPMVRKNFVAGLLCIDTLNTGAFKDVDGEELKRNLFYMRQLTSIAFMAFEKVEAVKRRTTPVARKYSRSRQNRETSVASKNLTKARKS